MRPILAPDPLVPPEPGPAPSFSVIIPAYQVAEYIGEALDSLLAQTLAPHEIVVCDDGSTDDLMSALRPYREHVTLVRKENGGVSSACNAAAAVATGDFVLKLDPDDVYRPQRLEALAELAVRRPDLDILTTDARLEIDGRDIGPYYTPTNRFEVGDQREGILRANFLFGLLAVRRRRLLEVGGFDESIRVIEDWDCWIRLILAGARAGMVDEPLARYRLRSGSLSSVRLNLLAGRVDVLSKALARADLTASEREVAASSLAVARRSLTRESALAAIMDGDADGRRQAWRLLLSPKQRMASRTKAALAVAAPGRARALLRSRMAADEDSELRKARE